MGPHRKKLKLADGGVAIPPTTTDVTENEHHEPPAEVDSAVAKPEKPRRSLFVKGLAPETTTDDLTDLFSQSYPLKHATAIVDPSTQKCKGYGFVTFADAEDAERAKEEFKNHELHGRKMKIGVAEPRQRREKGQPGVTRPKSAKSSKDASQVDESPRLIVRNLPWSVKTPEQLAEYFRPHGAVKQVILPEKPGSGGLLRGFGIVIMKKRKTAQTAIEKLSGKEIDGRALAVDWAVDKSTWQTLQKSSDVPGADEDEDEDDSSAANGTDLEDEEQDDDEDEEASQVDDAEEEEDSEDGGFDEGDSFDDERLKATLFVRNLPFSATDESLEDHFSRFGAVRYTRINIDHNLHIPKGTGFVCFYNERDAQKCLKEAPREKIAPQGSRPAAAFSVIQNTDNDSSGHYTINGRVLQLSQAVNHRSAEQLKTEGETKRFSRDKDKRRLFLLSEGTISTKSPLYKKLSPSDIAMREASVKQRKTLLQTNPSLHLSLTRLSVRNIPRSIDSKQLKALAREAVVGFATDVKNEIREPLAKEEIARSRQEMKEAEQYRKKKAVGIVKQAKVEFESREGGKVDEKSGAGRSRGYGFIEYYTHRNALMGLRWLNGNELGYKAQETRKKTKGVDRAEIEDRKKRLIVEFAIENAQVVHRRKEREAKDRLDPKAKAEDEAKKAEEKQEKLDSAKATKDNSKKKGKSDKGRKRKRVDEKSEGAVPPSNKTTPNGKVEQNGKLDPGINRVIARNRHEKRHARKMRNAAG